MFVKTVYIDASCGFKGPEGTSGIAVVYDNRYIAVNIRKCGTNTAELMALRLALQLVPIRPILIITDSKHVEAHAPKEHGLTVEWRKRNTNIQMEMVDVLSKLVARMGRNLSGTWGDETYKRLMFRLGNQYRVKEFNDSTKVSETNPR